MLFYMPLTNATIMSLGPFLVHIDHSSIKYILDKPMIIGRIICSLLLLQEFDLTILDNTGRENVVADFCLG